MLLGGSALAAVSMADRILAQEPGDSPPVSSPQSPAPHPPSETPPPTPGSGTTLPTISVQAARPKPKPVTARPAATNQTAQPALPLPVAPAGVLPGGPFAIDTTIKDYGSIRGRAGVAFDRFLVFGTAGLAWGNPSNAYALAGSAPLFTNGGYSYGWTAGAGVDCAITDSVFGRLEYRHTNLQKPGFADAASDTADTANKIPINDFRAGIGYKL
jgi:hypothetical protein